MNQQTWIGRPMPRREDQRFLTGTGCYTDDIARPGMVHGLVLRSPHPHALVAGIDTAAARSAPGVLAVLTAADIAGEIAMPIPSHSATPPFDVGRRNGGPAAEAPQHPLATDRVRYLGEPVAFVVAETEAQARDAAERIAVDYEVLPAVTDYAAAMAPGAPLLWENLDSNLSFTWEGGDAAATERAFAEAAHVTRLRLENNRVVVAFMEPRSALAEMDAASGRLTLHAGCQSAHGIKAGLCAVLGLQPEDLRVVAPDTGGGFGARGAVYPEFALTLLAARRLGRPVKWTEGRDEAFLSDTQSRDHVIEAELALDEEGRFTGLRTAIDWRHGAYLVPRSIWVMVAYLPPTMGGAYRIPCAHTRLRGIFTNTTPMAALRGIGRVEANYIVESLIDAAARETGRDRLALRRLNLVGPEAMPWRAAGGNLITSGDFPAGLDRATALADWAGFARRREESAARGLLRGIGLGVYVENDGGAPGEFAEVAAGSDGTVTLFVGTQDFGMGHATMYAQVLADQLGLAPEAVTTVFGDTDRVARGAGAHGSRSARIGGGATVLGARAMVERGKALAADLLEASAGDVEYAAGRFAIAGTDRAASLAEVARFAEGRGDRLAGDADFLTTSEVHSNGCHVCEVEIDPASGTVRIARYSVVADVGRIINPLIVTGQIHGGAAQGIGQALMERIVYDAESGQTLSGSFMDYALPRADDLPLFAVEFNEVVESDNPLGVKGAGESATTGAPAAVMNAVRDALAGAGVRHLDMPATPERVWQALQTVAPQ